MTQNNKNLALLFSTPIANISLNQTSILDQVSSQLISAMQSDSKSKFLKTGHYCTLDNLNLDNTFNDIVSIIDYEVGIFAEEIYKIKSSDISLSCMWANIRSSESKHHIHLHQNSFISGVLYLSAPNSEFKNPGDIFFVDPRMGNRTSYADHTDDNNCMSATWKFTPEKGMMLLFPGWLEHGTDAGNFEDTDYRICLSFNYVLKHSNQMFAKL